MNHPDNKDRLAHACAHLADADTALPLELFTEDMTWTYRRPGTYVEIRTRAGLMDGWLARPASRPRGVVIVLPEIFGLTGHVPADIEALAGQGYLALGINLFYRVAPRLALERDEAGVKQGLALLEGLRRDSVLDDVDAAIAFAGAAAGASDTAVLGFSSGGHVAYLAACLRPIRSGIAFYGGWVTNDGIPLSRPEPTIALTPRTSETGAKLLYIVGDNDCFVDADARAQLGRAFDGTKHELVVLPGAEHGFLFNDAANTRTAWARTLAVLGQELRG